MQRQRVQLFGETCVSGVACVGCSSMDELVDMVELLEGRALWGEGLEPSLVREVARVLQAAIDEITLLCEFAAEVDEGF